MASRRSSRSSIVPVSALPPPSRELEQENERKHAKKGGNNGSQIPKKSGTRLPLQQADRLLKPPTQGRPSTALKRPSTLSSRQSSASSRPSMLKSKSSMTARPSSMYTKLNSAKTIGNEADKRESRSSFYGQTTGPQIKKDPRNISDKGYQSRSIKKLLAFLKEAGYPSSLTYQNLQSPSGKEFCGIFNFIVERIDESLVITGVKMEEEVPRTLQYIGYPFTVAKSCLKSVGSPHAWPILLGALMWLINIVQVQAVNKAEHIFFNQEFGEHTDDEALHNKVCGMYSLFMKYGEECEAFQSEKDATDDWIKSGFEEALEEQDHLTQVNQELKDNIGILSVSKIPELEEELRHKGSKKQEYVQWIQDELVMKRDQFNQSIEDGKAVIAQFESDIVAEKAKIKELEDTIQKQPISANEAQRLYNEKDEADKLMSEIRKLEQEKEETRNEVMMQYNDILLETTAEVKQINEQIQWLSVSLKTRFTVLEFEGGRRADINSVNKLFERCHSLKGELEAGICDVTTKMAEVDAAVVTREETIASLQEEILKKQLEVENVQNTLEIKSGELQRKEKELEDFLKSYAFEKQMLEKQLYDVNKLTEELSRTNNKQKAEAKLKLEQRRQECESEFIRESEDLKQYLTSAIEFLEISKANISRACLSLTEELAELDQVKLLSVDPKYYDPNILLK